MIKPGCVGQWVTKRPPKDWLDGDLIFLWEGAPTLAVCGLAEIVRVEPADRAGNTHFWVRYLSAYLEHPLAIQQLRADARLKPASFLKSGAAGTLFPLSAAQGVRLASLIDRANPGLPSAVRRIGTRADTAGLALSIRQPWVELIMRGVKRAEFRSFATHKRGRVMVYASETQGPREQQVARRRRLSELPTGLIVGSVEIVGCTQLGPRDYAWALRRPMRLKAPLRPRKHAQPSFFRPF